MIQIEKREREPKRVINGIVINENKEVLLVQKKETLILPGGKMNPRENESDCLIREMKEELGTNIKVGDYFCKTEGISPHKKDEIQAKAYFVELLDDPKPSAEINALQKKNKSGIMVLNLPISRWWIK